MEIRQRWVKKNVSSWSQVWCPLPISLGVDRDYWHFDLMKYRWLMMTNDDYCYWTCWKMMKDVERWKYRVTIHCSSLLWPEQWTHRLKPSAKAVRQMYAIYGMEKPWERHGHMATPMDWKTNEWIQWMDSTDSMDWKWIGVIGVTSRIEKDWNRMGWTKQPEGPTS